LTLSKLAATGAEKICEPAAQASSSTGVCKWRRSGVWVAPNGQVVVGAALLLWQDVKLKIYIFNFHNSDSVSASLSANVLRRGNTGRQRQCS
jgi:hypothetical protein